MASTDTKNAKALFFDYLFGKTEGYVCVATAKPDRTQFRQAFYSWPRQSNELISFIEQRCTSRNVWFGVSLFNKAERSRGNSIPGSILWADLDEVNPHEIPEELAPSCVLESSPGRYQAFWRLDRNVDPEVAQEYSKRLAYHLGADKSGWDLEQLLRIPLTTNHKYLNTPQVDLRFAYEQRYSIDVFDKLPHVTQTGATVANLPDPPLDTELPNPELVLYKYNNVLLSSGFFPLYSEQPHETDDWSKRLWRLINICIETGMDDIEIFTLARLAKCNKYNRDTRPNSFLWAEIVKARANKNRTVNTQGQLVPLEIPRLVPHDYTPPTDSFITQYRDWASNATDAVPVFHNLCAFILLSSLLAAGIKLRVKGFDIYANLWGLVLGDSTLSRKTTAMRMVTDIITEIDAELLMSTDGSAEGLVSALSNRPNQVSIFFKDEVTGFFDSINRKDYLAGLPELLTQLYDVPSFLSRTLRKETITVSYPYFVFFGGGIRDKVFSLVPESFVLSGFLPRFLIVCGETDRDRLKPISPATREEWSERENIINRLRTLHARINERVAIEIAGQVTTIPRQSEIKLTSDAWSRYNEIEVLLRDAAFDSHLHDVALPTFTRLSTSILKMAMLLAVVRQGEPDDKNHITVEAQDIDEAAYYGAEFGKHAISLITVAGTTFSEKQIQIVMSAIKRTPGILRSELMQRHRLKARELKEIIDTLDQRGLVTIKPVGRGQSYYPVEV